MDLTCEDTCKFADMCDNAGLWESERRCKQYKHFDQAVKSERKGRMDRRREKGRDDDTSSE